MPCLVEKVRRNEITMEKFKRSCFMTINGEEISDEEIDRVFSTAVRFLPITAAKLNKFEGNIANIDDEVVREYFWNDHDEVVREKIDDETRQKYCYVLPGKVKEVSGNIAVVFCYKYIFSSN